MDDRDANLEDQTLDREEPGPGGSKAENIRRMKKQVRVHKERTAREMPEDEGIPDLDQALPEKEITGDPQEGLVVPRDDPRAVEEHGTTAGEQRDGESLDERLAREE